MNINIPGLALLLIFSWLLVFGAILMLLFLLVGVFTQRNLPFRRRWAFSLFLGMCLPFALGGIGMLLSYFGGHDVQEFLDKISFGWAIAPCFLVFLSGAGLGWWHYRRGAPLRP